MKRFIALLLCLLALCSCALAQEADGVIQIVPPTEPLPFLAEPNSLWVFCVPVGARDTYLLVCEGHAMVVDCGALGRTNQERYLLDLLDALHITRLDYAINTHPHSDHLDGFAGLLAEVPADEFLTCFPEDYDKKQSRLLSTVSDLGVPVRRYREGEPLPFGSAKIDTFRYHDIRNTNDLSLVMRVQYGERSILLTADIGMTAQRKLAEANAALWPSDIMKVPHHGVGQPAKALLDIVQPKLCFMSNIRNKSSRKAWTYLEKRGLPVLYTARELLALTTDGRVWAVQQWPQDSPMFPYEHSGAVQQ